MMLHAHRQWGEENDFPTFEANLLHRFSCSEGCPKSLQIQRWFEALVAIPTVQLSQALVNSPIREESDRRSRVSNAGKQESCFAEST